MKGPAPIVNIKHWRNENCFNIPFARYSLTHHSFPRHFHEHYVIQLVMRGTDNFYCNGGMHTAGEKELVFINPGEVHTGSTVSEEPLCYYSISPNIDQLQDIASILEKPLPRDFCFQNSKSQQPRLAKKMELLFNAIQCEAESLLCQQLFLDLMNDLLASGKEVSQSLTKNDGRVQQLIRFMRHSFTEPVSLQQMAEHTRMSPFHLIRVFKAATGLSPYEYLLTLRVEYAKHLLAKGRNVQDAALESGFYDTSHLNRMFRKVSGSTPKFFRLSK